LFRETRRLIRPEPTLGIHEIETFPLPGAFLTLEIISRKEVP